MDNAKQVQPLEEQEVPPTNARTLSTFIEAEKVRRSGGYFVGNVGWSGLGSSLIRQFISFVASGAIIIVGAVVWVALDESVRIGLRSLLGESAQETQREAQTDRLFPILQGESRNELTARWKQLLSEVQLEQSTYPPRFVALMRQLTLADTRQINQIAPYVVRGAILGNSEVDSGHDVPDLTWEDFARLKTIGILQQGQSGQNVSSDSQGGRPPALMLRGTTLALIVSAADASEKLEVPVTALTEEGKLIVELLDRATSLRGLCVSATRLIETGLGVRIQAKFEPGQSGWENPQSVGDITSLCLGD